MGAVASGGVRVLNERTIESLGISPEAIDCATAREQGEIQRREQLYRDGRPASPIKGRTVTLVDGGMATGASMLAAVKAVRVRQPKRIIVAVPVASAEACEEFRQEADDVICARTPKRQAESVSY